MAILPSVAQYTKNLARSTLFASAEVTGKLMPGFEDFKNSNREIFKEIYTGIKDYKRTITKLQAAIVQSKIFQAGEAGLRNLKEDLKTGNWYNENRQSRFEEKAISDSMGNSEFSFGDMGGKDQGLGDVGLGEFNADDMLGESEFDVSEDNLDVTDGEALIAQAVKDGAKDTSTVISATNVEIAQNAQKTQRVATSLLYAQNEKMMKIQQEGFTTMNETMGNLLKFDTEAMQTHLSNAKTFFEQSSKRDDERNAMLKEILEMQRNWYRAMQLEPQQEKEKKKKLTWDDISLNEGFPSLENYFEAIQENFKNTANDKLGGMFSMLDSMGGMMGDNPLMAMVQNPLGSLMTSLVTVALGPRVQRAAENLDKTASGVFGTMIAKFNRMAQEEDGIAQILGSIFGIRNTLKTTLDTTPKRGVTQWNLDDHKALTEVIPHYLANIDANLSGRPHQLYNYETGKYVNTADLQSQWNDMLERNRMKPFRDINQMMMKYLNSMKEYDWDQKVQLTKDWQSLMRYWFNHDGGVQQTVKTNLKDEEEVSDMAMETGIDEENFRTLINHIQKWADGDYGDKSQPNITHHGDLMLLNRDVMDARGAHNKEVQYMQDRGTIFENLFNNSYKQLRNIYTGQLSQDNQGFQDKLLLVNQFDERHNNIFYYLQNIFKTLLAIKIDGVGNGDGQKLREMLRSSDVKAKQRRQISQGDRVIYANPVEAAQKALDKFTPVVSDTRDEWKNLTPQQRYTRNQQKQREQYDADIKREAERKAKLGNKYSGPQFMFGINADGTEINPYDEMQLRQARAEASLKAIEKESNSVRKEDQEERGIIGDVFDYFKRDKDDEEYKKDIEKINKDGFLESLIKAESIGEKWNILRLSLEHLADQPANMLATVMEQADEKLYKFFFKEEPITVNGKTYTGFFGRMRGEMETLFQNINEGLNKHLLEPLKKKLGVEGPLDAVKKVLFKVGIDTEAIWKNMTEGFNETFEGVTENIKDTFTNFFQDAIDEIKTEEMKAREAEEEAQRKAQEEENASTQAATRASTITNTDGSTMSREDYDLSIRLNNQDVRKVLDKFGITEDTVDEALQSDQLKDVTVLRELIPTLQNLSSKKGMMDTEEETLLSRMMEKINLNVSEMGQASNQAGKPKLLELQEQMSSTRSMYDSINEKLKEHSQLAFDRKANSYQDLNRRKQELTNQMLDIQQQLNQEMKDNLTGFELADLYNITDQFTTPDKIRSRNIEASTEQARQERESRNEIMSNFLRQKYGMDIVLSDADKTKGDEIKKRLEGTRDITSNEQLFSGLDDKLKEDMQIAFDANRGFVFDLKAPQIDNFLLKGLGIEDDNIRNDLISSLKSKFETEGSFDNILDLKTIQNTITEYAGNELDTLEQAGIQGPSDQYDNLTAQLQDPLSRLLTRTGKISDFSTDNVLDNEFLSEGDDLGILDVLESGQRSSYDISTKILEAVEKLGETFTTPTAITEALTNVQTTISESISTGITTLSNKFDELITAVGNIGKPEERNPWDDFTISTHAEGTRMVTKAGITAISDGEMIVPANLNPFNPNREKVNIKSQLANEQRIRREYATDVAKSMINEGIPDKYKAGISTIPTNAQGWLNVDFDKVKDQNDYVNRIANSIADKIPTHAAGNAKVDVTKMEENEAKEYKTLASNILGLMRSIKDSIDSKKMNESDFGKVKSFLVDTLHMDKEEVEKAKQGDLFDTLRNKLFELRTSRVATEDSNFTTDDGKTYTLDDIKEVVGKFSQFREAFRNEELEKWLKENPTAKALTDSVNSIKEGVQEAFSQSLGLDSTRVKKAIKETSSTVKASTPDMISKGLLGGTLGLFLGGPLVGAVLGAGVGLVQNNEYFMEQLFGKKSLVDPKTGKPMREGGIIDRDTMDTFQQYFKPMLAHGALGSALGLITPFGPFGGAMIGASVGFLRKNKDFMDTFFGEEDGIIDKKAQEFIKKTYPNMAVTAIGTMFLGPFGLLGNAALGAGLGLLGSTNTFKDYIFGVEDPYTHKREGGFVGAIREGLVEPWVEFGKNFVKESMEWIRTDLFKPVKDAFLPITKQIQLGVTGLIKGAGMILGHQLEVITGRPFANKLKEYLFEPFSKIGQTIISAVTTPIKAAISLPFKGIGAVGDLLRRRHVQRGTASYMTAAERIGFRKDKGMDETDEYARLDETLAKADKNTLKKLYSTLQIMENGPAELDRQRGRSQKQLWSTIDRTLGKGKFNIFFGESERDTINRYFREGNEADAIKLIHKKTEGLGEEERQNIINQILGVYRQVSTSEMKIDNYEKDKEAVRAQLAKDLGITISDDKIGDIRSLISREIKAKEEDKSKIERSKSSESSIEESEGKLLEATQSQTDVLGSKLDEMIKLLQRAVDPSKATLTTPQTMKLASYTALGDLYNEQTREEHSRNSAIIQHRLKQKFGEEFQATKESLDILDTKEGDRRLKKLLDIGKGFSIDPQKLDVYMQMSNQAFDRMIRLFTETGLQMMDNNLSKLSDISDDQLQNVINAHKIGLRMNSIDEYKDISDMDRLRKMKMIRDTTGFTNRTLDTAGLNRIIDSGLWAVMSQRPEDYMNIPEKELRQLKNQKQDVTQTGTGDGETIDPELRNRNILNRFVNYMARTGISFSKPLFDGLLRKMSGQKFFEKGSEEYRELKSIEERSGIPIEDIISNNVGLDTGIAATDTIKDIISTTATGGMFAKNLKQQQDKALTAISEGELITKAQPIPVTLGKGTIEKLASNIVSDIPTNAYGRAAVSSDTMSKHTASTTDVSGDLSKTPVPVELGDDSIKSLSDNIREEIGTHASGGLRQHIMDTKTQIQREVASTGEDLSKVVSRKFDQERAQREYDVRRQIIQNLLAQGKSYAEAYDEAQRADLTGLMDKIKDTAKKTGYEKLVILDNLRQAVSGGTREDGQTISLLKTLLRGGRELASTSDSTLKVSLSQRKQNIRQAARNTNLNNIESATSLLRSLFSLGTETTGWTKQAIKDSLASVPVTIAKDIGISATPIGDIKDKVRDEVMTTLAEHDPTGIINQISNTYNQLPEKALNILAQNMDPELFNILMSQGDLISSNITSLMGASAKGGVRQRKKKEKQEEEASQPKEKSRKRKQEDIRKQRQRDEAEAASWVNIQPITTQIPSNANTNPTVDSPVPVTISDESKQELNNVISNAILRDNFQSVEQEDFVKKTANIARKTKHAQGVKQAELERMIKESVIYLMANEMDPHLMDSAHTWDDETVDKLYKMATGEENRKLMMMQIGRVTNLRDQQEKLDRMNIGQLREISTSAKYLERDQAIKKAIANGVDPKSLEDKSTEEIVNIAEQEYYSPSNAIGRVVKSAKNILSRSTSPLDQGQTIVDSVMDKVESAKDWVKDKKDKAVDWGAKVGRRVLIKINDIVDDIGKGISDKMGQFKDFVSDNLRQGIKWFTQKYDKFMADPKTQAMLARFTDFFDAVKDTAGALFSYGKENAGLFIETMADTIKEKAMLFYDKSTEWLKKTMEPYYEQLKGYLNTAWGGIKDFMTKTIWGGIKSGVGKVVDWAFGDESGKFKEKWTRRFANASESLNKFSDDIRERTAQTRVKRLARQDEFKGLDEDRLKFIDRVKQLKMEDIFANGGLDIKNVDITQGNDMINKELKERRNRKIDRDSSLSIIQSASTQKTFTNEVERQIQMTDVQNQLEQYKQLFIRKGLPEEEATKLIKSIQPSESPYLNRALNLVFGEEFAADKKDTRAILQDMDKIQSVSPESARKLVAQFHKTLKELKEKEEDKKKPTTNAQATLETANSISKEEEKPSTTDEISQRMEDEASAWESFGKNKTSTELPETVKSTTEEAESVAPKKEEKVETHAKGGVSTETHTAVVSPGESIGKVEPIPVKMNLEEFDKQVSRVKWTKKADEMGLGKALIFYKEIEAGKKPKDLDSATYKELRKLYRDSVKEMNIKKYGHIGALLKDVSDFLEKVGDTASAVYRYGKERAKIFFKAIGQTIKDKATEKFTAAKNYLAKKLDPVKQRIKEEYEKRKEQVKEKYEAAKGWVKEKIGDKASGAISKVTGWIGDKFSGASDTLESIRSGIQAEYDKIQKEKNKSGNNYDTLVQAQKLAIEENAKALESNAEQVVAGFKEGLTPVIETLRMMLPEETRRKLEEQEEARQIKQETAESVQGIAQEVTSEVKETSLPEPTVDTTSQKIQQVPEELKSKDSGEQTTIPTPYGIAKAKESRDGSLIPANKDAEDMMEKVEDDHTANLETRDTAKEILEFLKGEDSGDEKEKKDEESIFDKLLKGFNWLKAALFGAIGALMKWLKDFKLPKWEDIKTKLSNIWDSLKQRAEEFWKGVKRRAGEFYDAMARRFGALWERIKKGPEEVVKRIKEIPGKIGDMIGRISESAQRKYNQMIESIQGRFGGMVDSIASRFHTMIDDIGAKFGGIVEAISTKLGSIGTTITERGGQIVDSVTSKGQEIASRVSGKFREVFGHDSGILEEVRGEMAAADAKNAAKESLKSMSPEELTRLQQVYNAPGIQAIIESGHIPPGMNPETFAKLQAIGEMGPEAVSRLIEGVPAETPGRVAGALSIYRSVGGVSGVLKGTAKFIADTAIHAPGDALKGISNIATMAKDGITGNLEKATKGIMNVSAPVEVGKASNIVNHILGPILTGLGKIAELVGKVIGQVPGAKPQEIGKAFQKFGTALAEKVAQKAGARLIGQALLRFIPFAGQAYMAYAGIKAFYEGMNNPGLMLHISDPDKISISQRILAGITNAVVDLCTFGILTADDVLPLVLEHIAPFLGVAEETTKDMQESEKEYEDYKKKTGKADLSFKDFLKETGRYKELGMLDNLKDIGSSIGETIKDKVGGMFDSIKETGENLSKWITDSSELLGKSIGEFAINVKDTVLNGIEDTATTIQQRATVIGVGVIEGKPLKIINEAIKPSMSYLFEKDISFGKAIPGLATIPFAVIGVGIASITSVLGSVKDFLGKTFDGLTGVKMDLNFYWDYKGNPFDKKYLDHVGAQYDPNNPITAIPSIMESIAKYFLLPFKAIGMVVDWVKEKAGGILKKVNELKNMLPFIGNKTDTKTDTGKGNQTTTNLTTTNSFTLTQQNQPVITKEVATKTLEVITKQDGVLGSRLKKGLSVLQTVQGAYKEEQSKNVSQLLDQQPARAEVEKLMKNANAKLPKDKQLDYDKTKQLIIKEASGTDTTKYGRATKKAKTLDTYGRALSNAVNYSQVSSDVKDIPMNIAGDTQKESVGTRGCSVTIGSAISKFGVLPDKEELIKDAKSYLAKDDGTSFGYFSKEANKYGMESKQTQSTSTIMDHLKKGGSTVLMGTGNDLFGDGHHYVSATGLGKSKQGEDLVEINDPERLGSKVFKKKDVMPYVETGFNIQPRKGRGRNRVFAINRYGKSMRYIENDPRYHGPQYNMMHSDDTPDVKEAKLKTQMQWIEDNPKEAILPDSKDYRPAMNNLSDKVPQRFQIDPQKDNVVTQREKMKKQKQYLGNKQPRFSLQNQMKEATTTFGKAFQRFGKDNEKKDETKTDATKTDKTTSSGNNVVLSDNMNEEQIWDWFRWRGYNENAAAGIMGRLKQENNFSPKYARFENVPGVGECGGMGMFQWTWDTGTGYEHPDLDEGRKVYPESRLASYLQWCDDQKVKYESTSSQLNYLWDKDLNSQEHVLWTGYNFRPPEMNAMSATEAASHWTKDYERGQPGNEATYAEEFLAKYKDRPVPDGSTVSTSSSDGSLTSTTPAGSPTSNSSESGSTGGIIDTLMNKLLKPMIDMYNALFGGGESASSSSNTPGASAVAGASTTTGSNNGVSPMGGDIKSASEWAETQVGTQGFGNNGCTEWVKRYLLKAGSPFGKMMEAGTPTAKDCWDGHEADLMWVPSIMTYAKEHNLYKPGTAPGNRGDIAMINTNGSKEDGPDHVVIAKGDGDYWGNSSSRNQIVSSNIANDYGADNVLGYVATGEGSGGTVSTGSATRSQAEIDGDAGSSASSSGMGTNIDKTLQDGSMVTPQVDEYTLTKFDQLSSKYGKANNQTIAEAQQQALNDPNEILNLAQQLKDEHIINNSDMNKIDVKMKPKNSEEAKSVEQSRNDALNLLNDNKDSLPEVTLPAFMQEQQPTMPKIEPPTIETSEPELPKPTSDFGTCAGKDKYGKAVSTEATAPEMWKFMKSKGLSDVATAGILGNLKAESSLESNILQGGGHSDDVVVDNVTGYGLAQWTSQGRQQKLAEWQASHQLQGSDWKGQLDFLVGGHDEPIADTLKMMDETKDPYKAALVFHKEFERSADTDEMAARRGEYAKDFFANQGGSTNGTSTAPTGNSTTGTAGGTNDTLSGVLGGAFGAIAAMLEKAMAPLVAKFKAMYGGLLGGGGNKPTTGTPGSTDSTSTSTTVTTGDDVGSQMLAGAQDFVNRQVPYVWGGADASGADCSGMVKYISDKIGFSDMPRTADIQEEFFRNNSLSYNDKTKAQPGDLVFFKKADQDYVHHVGVIKSGTNFIHEPCTGRNAEDTGDINTRDDFYAIGDVRALWEKTHSGTKPTPYGGIPTQDEDKKESTADSTDTSNENKSTDTTLGTGTSMTTMDEYMNARMMNYTPKEIDDAAQKAEHKMRLGKGNLEAYEGIPDNLIDDVNDDESVYKSKIQAQQKWIDEHKPSTLAETQKEALSLDNNPEEPTIIEPKLETSKVFDEDFIKYFKKEISRLDERIDKVEKGLVPTTKKEVQKELDKKDKQIDELEKKVDKKNEQIVKKKDKQHKSIGEKIQDSISGIFESITGGWSINGKHKIRFSSGDTKQDSSTTEEDDKKPSKTMTLDERIKYEQWKNLEDAPEVAPNGIHYKENDIQYLMNQEKITREQAIDILKTDNHYKEDSSNVSETKKQAKTLNKQQKSIPTEEEIEQEKIRKTHDIDRARLNGTINREYENEDYRRTMDGRIVDKENGQIQNLAEVMSRESGRKFKVIGSGILPEPKKQESMSEQKKSNIPIDFMKTTSTFPEHTVDEDGNIIPKQESKQDFGSILTSLGLGMTLGNLGDNPLGSLFGGLFKRKIDRNNPNGVYTGTKESLEASQNIGGIGNIFNSGSKTGRNIGLGLLGAGLLTNLFKKPKKQESITEEGQNNIPIDFMKTTSTFPEHTVDEDGNIIPKQENNKPSIMNIFSELLKPLGISLPMFGGNDLMTQIPMKVTQTIPDDEVEKLTGKTNKELNEYKEWKNLEDAPEVAPNGIHYKENDIQYLMNQEKITREQAIDILKTDNHYRKSTEEEIEQEKTRKIHDIDRARLNGKVGKEYENEDYRRTADGRIIDKQSGEIQNLAEVMSRESGRKFKVIGNGILPEQKKEDDDLISIFTRKSNIPIDFMKTTSTFPEHTVDENGNIIPKQESKQDFGSILTSLGLGMTLGNLDFGGLFKGKKQVELDNPNGVYTGTKESLEASQNVGGIGSIFNSGSKTGRNIGLGLLGIGLLTNLFKKHKKQESMTEEGQSISKDQSIEDPTKQVEDKINTIKGLKQDSLGNYEAYQGMPENLITEEDDILTKTKKIETQEQWLKDNNLWIKPVKEELNVSSEPTKEVQMTKKMQGDFKEQEEQAKIRLAKQQEAEQKRIEQDEEDEQVRQEQQQQQIIQQQRQEAIATRQQEQALNMNQTATANTTEDSKLNEFGAQILSVLQTIAENTSRLVEYFANGGGTPNMAASPTVNNLSSMNTMFSGSTSQGEYNSGANKMAQMIQKLLTK